MNSNKLQSTQKSQGFPKATPSSYPLAGAVTFLLLCVVSSGFADSEKERRFPLLFDMVYHNPGESPFVTHYDEPRYLK